MTSCRTSIALALCALLGACAISTPGSQATVKGQSDCVAAAARRFQVPADQIQVDNSGVTVSGDVYEVQLRHTATGRRAKCTVDQNGIVLGVIELR
jgi:hypothetical protein